MFDSFSFIGAPGFFVVAYWLVFVFVQLSSVKDFQEWASPVI
jgi:hypothetical protein